MKKLLLPALFISTIYLFAQTPVDEGHRLESKPVDEGQKNTPVKDTIKGAKDINNSYEYQAKSLEKMKSIYTIKRKDITYAPFTLLHYNGKDGNITTLKVEKSSVNSINFNVEKSILEVGDRILVINNKNSSNKYAPKGKEVIVEVEITK